MKRNKENTQETVRKLLDVGRRHFAERGYAEAAMEEIVREAELTRGALYHHFGNKRGLFVAVLETVQSEIASRIETAAAASEDGWEQLLAGCRTFLEAAVEPENKRIMLIDGPAVLGWEEWRRMDEENAVRHLREQLQEMAEAGVLKERVPVEALTHALSGAMNEAALWIAQAADARRATEETMSVVALMLEGYRIR